MNRLGLVWTCLLALAAAFATACPAPSPTATPVTAQYPLEFTTIEQSLGHMPYFYDKAPRLLVIASSREAQTDVPLYLYPEFQRPNDPGDTVTQIRGADFNRYFVVAAFQGYGGAGIRVSRIWRQPDRVVIEARFEQSSSDKTPMQSPYHVLMVSRQGVPEGTKIAFVLRDETGKEQASTDHSIIASLPPTLGPSPIPTFTPLPISTRLPTPTPRPPTPTYTPYPVYVDISMMPERLVVHVGEQFLITLQVETNDTPLVGIDSFIDFDPNCLEVVAVRGGQALPIQLMNRYDNEKGQVDLGAGILGSTASGNFVLATIEFRAKERARGTLVSFSQTAGRQTDAALEGRSVLRSANGATVEIY